MELGLNQVPNGRLLVEAAAYAYRVVQIGGNWSDVSLRGELKEKDLVALSKHALADSWR